MDYQSLIVGAMALAIGLPRVVAPHRSRALKQHDREMRMAEIEAGAPERFLEEYRSLKAYPVTTSSRTWLAIGWVAVLVGILCIAMGLIGKQAFLAL